jgi:hypothetical protein
VWHTWEKHNYYNILVGRTQGKFLSEHLWVGAGHFNVSYRSDVWRSELVQQDSKWVPGPGVCDNYCGKVAYTSHPGGIAPHILDLGTGYK